ncbi:MAG: T9SS type A sorting domain-containing protein [Candidatus Limimorpha sp.]
MRKLSLLLLLLTSLLLKAENADTLKVMQYNLLNYGNYTSYCPQDVNNVADKNEYIRTILTAYYPDILTVCEVGKGSNLPSDFVNNNLNINGINFWKTKAGSNTNNSSLTNCIFYNSTKLQLMSHNVAQTYIRDVDVYDFKILGDEREDIYLTCVVGHLKAGSGSENESGRKLMANNIMKYLEANYKGRNVLIMGDFNLYGASEPAYVSFTNKSNFPNSYFIDPVYPYGVGEWNSNINYEEYHTQSTHRDNDGCHSSGGLDDRFDFILMSENIYGGNDNVLYINGSYKALGQDGHHFNKSINSPDNTAVSKEVADALYKNSDHLPVTMELVVNKNFGFEESAFDELSYDIFPNPTTDNIYIRFYQGKIGNANIMVFNAIGQIVVSNDVFVEDGVNEYQLSLNDVPQGIYFLRITNSDGLMRTIKIIKE